MGYDTVTSTAVADEAAPGWAARLPVYYGWVNVVVAAVAMSATLPGRTYGLGLIKEPLRADLGIGDLAFNWMNFWAIVIGAAFVPPVGWLIDRLGGRGTLALVAAALGGAVLLMSRATGEIDLFVTLTPVRGLGQGALSVVAIALVGKWFRRRAGMAMGVFTVLLAVGFIAPIGIVGEAVKTVGWRAAWDGVGVALLFGLVPLGLLVARSSPESCGVPPDEPAPDAGHAEPMPLRAAIATPAFWAYTAAATVFSLTFSALTLDNELLLKEHGLDAAGANQLVLGVLMLSGLPANIAAGYLARRVPLGKLLGGGVLILAASLAVFPSVSTTGAAVGYAVLLGVGGGVITVVYFAVYGHTYGRTHLGSIQAAVQVLTVFASAAGPVLLAAVREGNGGSTTPFFYAFAAITAAIAGAAWVVRPPAARAS
ncbi:MAG TPA: MFS transporter [Urbifossiella sp.]|jgi:MFS family permease|nr:MFS transporter [Urbifossiella sp.]